MFQRFTDNNKVVSALVPLTGNSDRASSAIDTLGYDQVFIVFAVGAAGDTWSSTNKIEMEIQDGATTTTAAAADASLTTVATGATNTGTAKIVSAAGDASKIYTTQYTGKKRYIKAVVNFSGTHTNGSPTSVTVILGNPVAAPAA
jgi:hypothetical protein